MHRPQKKGRIQRQSSSDAPVKRRKRHVILRCRLHVGGSPGDSVKKFTVK
jgi:hypothetical protein